MFCIVSVSGDRFVPAIKKDVSEGILPSQSKRSLLEADGKVFQ